MQLARQSTQPGLLSYSAAVQRRHEAATSADARKERGQVFTPPSVCNFMAGVITRIPDRFRLLDAGAGVGSLAAAVCERVLTLGSRRHIELVLYENDPTLLRLLEENMRHCREALIGAGHELRYAIHDQDFILSTRGRSGQRGLFDDDDAAEPFDAAILNPPSFKIGADSAHALAMGDVFQGQTNIYMLFIRTISGNTQVNATELRSIRFPSLDVVAVIGNRLKKLGGHQPWEVEGIVLEVLGINGRLGGAVCR
jgi:hypothetical protein